MKTSHNEEKEDKTTHSIHQVIFNDKFAYLKPTTKSDFSINYVKPEQSAYRKKRTVLLFPKRLPAEPNTYLSEYKQKFVK